MKECLLSARHRDGIEHTVHGPDELDAGALRRHLRVALAAGVAGFLAPAMAREVDKLTPAERDLFVGRVLKESEGPRRRHRRRIGRDVSGARPSGPPTRGGI